MLHVLLANAPPGNIVHRVFVGCLGDDVAEEPHDEALVGDLEALAHVSSILLKLVKDYLSILCLVIHPGVNVLSVPHRRGIENKLGKVLLGKHGLEPLYLVFGKALLMNEGFKFGGHSEVITLNQPLVLVIRQETLGLQIIHKHHQVTRAAQPASLAANKAVSFQEEQPEVGEWQEFLLVSEDVQVEQFGEKEFPLRRHMLELNLEDSPIIIFRVIVLGELDVDMLVI